MTLDRNPIRVGRYDNLPRDIESSFADLLDKEIQLIKKLDMLKGDLLVRYDFNNYGCFKHIDRDSDGVIDTYNLSNFLKNNGHYASERDLLNIIRRIDTDGDAKLSYEEFADFLKLSITSSNSIM